MTNCRNMEELIATSLYEALEPGASEVLQSHLADCAACRAEYASLQAFVGQLAPAPIVFLGDLLPSIREELRRSESHSWFAGWMRTAVAIGVGLFVIGGTAFVFIDSGGKNPGQIAKNQPAEPPTIEVAAQPTLDPVVSQARKLAASDQPASALTLLKDALATERDGERAGELQLEMAEIEYTHFHRYEVAYGIYGAVRETKAFTLSPGIVKERYDLLTEARDANFEPLYQIDAAMKQGESGMPTLEQVMARYPGRFVAQAAMETMVAMADGEGLGRLEDVRSHCTNPVALAQLDVRLGEGYCAGNLDPAKGKALLHAVADSPYSVPAQMAKDVLARLEAGEGR